MGTRPYTIDPQVAHERAKKAARASHSLDSYVKRIVDRAPELTAAQIDRLTSAFRRKPDGNEAGAR
jgi:hypothetical protein